MTDQAVDNNDRTQSRSLKKVESRFTTIYNGAEWSKGDLGKREDCWNGPRFNNADSTAWDKFSDAKFSSPTEIFFQSKKYPDWKMTAADKPEQTCFNEFVTNVIVNQQNLYKSEIFKKAVDDFQTKW